MAGIADFVDQAAAADLVTFDGTALSATLLPLIWVSGTTRGTAACSATSRAANPQWQTAQPGLPALAIFHGPQAYVSPSWYQSTREHGRTVPTWNYTTVHMSGPVSFHRDEDWLLDVVTRLTERHEAGRPGRWWVQDAPPKFIAGQLRAIVGVEMQVRAHRGQGQALPEPHAAGPRWRDRRTARRTGGRAARDRRADGRARARPGGNGASQPRADQA